VPRLQAASRSLTARVQREAHLIGCRCGWWQAASRDQGCRLASHKRGSLRAALAAGTALVPYVLAGAFGAALWGPAAIATGNMLDNSIFGPTAAGLHAQAAISVLMAGAWAAALVRGRGHAAVLVAPARQEHAGGPLPQLLACAGAESSRASR